MLTRIAILLTSHNRKSKTLEVLRALGEQDLPPDAACEIYLMDDGSTDGTAEAVEVTYPSVRLFRGNGSYFWNGGMRVVFGKALREDFDLYILLNDDTNLAQDAIGRLLKTSRELAQAGEERAVVVGSIQDANIGVCSYGGVVRSSRLHPLRFRRLTPTGEPQRCDTFNGNCVLIPRTVAQRVGNLSDAFQHSMGDFDYGMRAQKLGCSVWVAPGYYGTCSRNPAGRWEDASLPLRDRWRLFCGVKGLPPKEWKVWARDNAGPLWPIYFLSPYANFLARQCFHRRS